MSIQKRNINYINKDFNEFRANLIDFAKTYFPTTYTDFSPSSPGMMFMEMAAYIGDVLSFYMDNQFQETFINYARQSNNLYELAYMFGYKPKVTQVATVDVDFYQQVPSILSGSTYLPDFNYTLFIDSNSIISSTQNNIPTFLIEDPIDFSISNSLDPTEISILSVSGGNPTFYLLKKTKKAISATINSTTFTFTSPEKFTTIEINDNNIIGILDIIDSDGNKWYEVDYLAQETVFDSIKNTNPNDPNMYSYKGDVPYLLKLKQVQRRFVSRFVNTGSLQIQFGSGTVNDNDEIIIPNPNNVGIGLPFEKTKLTTAYSPNNFMFTKTYGIAPSNTTLTIRYLTGGGVLSNIPSNTLNSISGNIKFLNNNLNSTTANSIYNSLSVNNPNAADGGGDGDSIEEIRQNSMANFSSQLRNITPNDYLVRSLSMPSIYGVISKAFVEPTKLSNSTQNSTLDLYILSYNNLKQLTTSSIALKENLISYLSQYSSVDDKINIKDGFIINIGINFDIIVLPNYNSNDIILKCINALKDYFNVNNWLINQPIILKELYILLDKIEGVQTVKSINIINKVGEDLGYSKYAYDINSATINNIIYPSLDASIFEVKYPDTDILGRCSNF